MAAGLVPEVAPVKATNPSGSRPLMLEPPHAGVRTT